MCHLIQGKYKVKINMRICALDNNNFHDKFNSGCMFMRMKQVF